MFHRRYGKISGCWSNINYNDDEYSQGYSQIEEVFRAVTKDDIVQPFKSEDDFRSSNASIVELGYS